MIKVDLVTGFLGSGKTTFILKYAAYWLAKGQRIGIIENDFGAINVDMMLLKQLPQDRCLLEMVIGPDEDCRRRRFKTKLIAMGMQGFDRVIVEPSGIFDSDEFFDVLYEEPLDQWYEIGNVLAIVDARLETQLSKASQYLLASQISNAGKLVLTHCDQATENDIDATFKTIQDALSAFRSSRKLDAKDIIKVNLLNLDEEKMQAITTAGYQIEDHMKYLLERHQPYQSLFFYDSPLNLEKIKNFASELMKNEDYGHVFRIKGFVLDNQQWMSLNATRTHLQTHPIDDGQHVIIIIGEGLNEEKIKQYHQELR